MGRHEVEEARLSVGITKVADRAQVLGSNVHKESMSFVSARSSIARRRGSTYS
jgi:hypothetical protein